MLPDGRVKLNRSGDWGEARPVYVEISSTVPLTVLSADTTPVADAPLFRVKDGAGAVVIPEAAPDGYSDPGTLIRVWWYPDLEDAALAALADGEYQVEFRFSALAAGETKPRRYVRSVALIIG